MADPFPSFDPSWILHQDAEVLVVDKPPFVAAQAADPETPDDLPTRLGAWLAAQGEPDYLGIHQRLDHDTSGVVLFVRDRSKNGAVARAFEGRGVKKEYLAVVRGWRGRAEATLRHRLLPGDDGRMVDGPRGKPAVTHVRVLERRGERALLALELETGRTHQARAQLALAGSPIAGDVLYGGERAARLMLHAHVLELPRGTFTRTNRFRAEAPAELRRHLAHGPLGPEVYDAPALVRDRLAAAARRRFGLARAMPDARRTTAFRLVHEDGDALPGLAIDVYGEHLVVQLYVGDGTWEAGDRRERLLDEAHALGFAGVYLKLRPRQANTLVDTRREEVAPKDPVRGASAPAELVVHEEGVRYRVRLGDGLSTGLFLDQRQNRRRVRLAAPGKRVANLFAYTCGFTVAAVAGGATRTVSVDASLAALERGRAGLAELGATLTGHEFLGDDAFAWLERARKKNERWDLLVLDPPSYSTTRKGRFVAETDYVDLAASALRVLDRDGQMLACTNHRRIHPAKFRRILFEAARRAEREVARIKDLPTPADHPVAAGAESHLKSAWVTLRGL
jgi:23S rRNA (cytosine1962-C5)-methyltransferase